MLVGEATLALVRDAADVEPVGPLELKGKSAPVPAYRLLGVHDAPERAHAELFVGRGRELALVHEAWEGVRAERCCVLVTIAGDAGVGKSRLAAEALVSINATITRGRCLPYGAGITYSPVVEVLKQLNLLPPSESAAVAIRALLGDTDAPTSPEEIAWAFRKTLEHAAVKRALVVVFDDLQWGEQTFLDLIEHVVLMSSGASILVLCMTRPELAEHRPTWPVTLRLEPLGDSDVDQLIPERISGELRRKITRAAGGNPLFIEEMLAITGEGRGDVVVPPTLQALLAARLDRLDPAERSVLERGAIEGEIFHRGAVQALAPDQTQVTPNLAALVRKTLIRPDRPQILGEDAFRFRHLLLRDAAYNAAPKARRADLHQRFATWLQEHGSKLVELDEILGHHLEQAVRYHADLGLPVDMTLAAAARRHLLAGGLRAVGRQDYAAAVNLFERSTALMPPHSLDLRLEIELGHALYWTGRAGEAVRRADALAERASASGDRVGELCGRIIGGLFGLSRGHEGDAERLFALLGQALPELDAAGDDMALYIAESALAEVCLSRGEMEDALAAEERAYAHARQVGYTPPGATAARGGYRYLGTTPAPELITWLDENDPRGGRDHFLRAYRAGALTMLGRFDEARAILAEERAHLAERGGGILLACITAFESVRLELLAGDPAAAREFARTGFRMHEALGDQDHLAESAGMIAHALYALDRLDDAYEWSGRAAELGTTAYPTKEMSWRRVRAKILARRGEHAEAQRLACEAVAIGEGTDRLDQQGDAYADLAEVFMLSGQTAQAAEALYEALDRYERKGNLVMAGRTRDRLAASAAQP